MKEPAPAYTYIEGREAWDRFEAAARKLVGGKRQVRTVKSSRSKKKRKSSKT